MEDYHTAKIISVKEITKTCRLRLSAGRNISRLNNAYVLLLSLLSPLCRVFAIIYMKQTMYLGSIVLHLFCIYSLCYM